MTGAEVRFVLARAGLDVPDQIGERLAAYLEMVLVENERQNLTALRTEQLFLSGIVDAALSFDAAGRPQGPHLDVGSGTGLPAIPWAILGGGEGAVLVESERRKRDFLARAISELAIPGAEAVWGRAEELAHAKSLRESMAVVTAQAVAAAPIALELCAGFVRMDGLVALPKGPDPAAEAERAVGVAERMGMAVLPPRTYGAPETGERTLLLYRKKHPTPKGRPAPYARLRSEFAAPKEERRERDARQGRE